MTLGDLDRMQRVVKVLGMVNAVPEFGEQPKVINGCSDLFVEVFGDKDGARASSLADDYEARLRAARGGDAG